ncbi:MAG TPA: adenylate/guanylate cyclase domain-containing protein [Myxococcales bacterium]|nr:adenylate/guanylate cyclase domain-containing protein [Myxococcales bacterium]
MSLKVVKTASCPNCKTALGTPPPSVCPNCGKSLVAPGQPRLVMARADGKQVIFPLNQRVTLGRHPANVAQLDDREVSKEHAVIEAVGGAFRIKDLNSSNGTFVNGRRVAELALRDGDEIRLGATRLQFRVSAGAPAPSRTSGFTVMPGANVLSNVLASVRGEEADFKPEADIRDAEALRRDYEKLRAALEFQRQVGIETELSAVLTKTLAAAFDMLKADNGAILLKGSDGKLHLEATRRRAEKGNQDDVVVSATLLDRVMASREGVLTADAIMDERFVASKSIVAQGIRSAMAVPLISKGEVRGVLFLDTRERTGAFTDKDLRILSAIGSQAAAALESAELRRALAAEERERDNLARFLPPVLVDQVAKGEIQLQDAGELRNITVLFSDIRGFTSLAETSEPQEVVRMLKEYFELMAEVVFSHRGIVDKFIGDAVMALWGAPEPLEDSAVRACRAAMEMQMRLREFNAQRLRASRAPVGVGVGINTGLAVVGVMGSSRRPEYTAIGDTVNVASRLCGLAGAGEVLISAETAREAGDAIGTTPLPAAQVKGRTQRVAVFKVTPPKGFEDEPTFVRG